MGHVIAIFLLSLCLVGCGQVVETPAESSAEFMETKQSEEVIEPTEESVETTITYKFGQDVNEYVGTELEVFGLQYEGVYVNLADCTFRDFVWLLEKSGIEVDVRILNERVEGQLYKDVYSKDGCLICAVELINKQGKEIRAKDCEINTLMFTPQLCACDLNIVAFDNILKEINKDAIAEYMCDKKIEGEYECNMSEIKESCMYKISDIGFVIYNLYSDDILTINYGFNK